MKHSQKFLQRRKFVMVLPMLVLPFLAIIFWALGGGQGSPAQAQTNDETGLNLKLPDAHFNNEEWNKLALYERAERDSLKFEEERKSDPYFDLMSLGENPEQEIQQEPARKKTQALSGNSGNTSSSVRREAIDPNEEKVNQKLEQLYRELNKPAATAFEETKEQTITSDHTDPQFSSDVKDLEKMMEMMNKGNEADPEMEQIESMLDKILDIQHPDRVREKIKEQSEQKQGQVFPVEPSRQADNITLMNPVRGVNQVATDSSALVSRVFSVKPSQNSFYGLDDEIQDEQSQGNAIEAVIHDTQELVAGATVKMRLLNDVYINGKLIAKDQFVYGTCAIEGERLTVSINSIRNGNSLFPVSLSVFDMDGLEGIYIPGAITRDVAQQSSDQALQGMQFLSMDQSLGAQAATAGIAAAKGLFSKKVKLIKVVVKAGYQILLKDSNQSNQ
ncbi:MAG TPA: conjugative transposon protein TraM [Cyclobacteriaceae bacterium]|nr:conjugative transposon protein TraM [Cyclobacteriaceae bacterium]